MIRLMLVAPAMVVNVTVVSDKREDFTMPAGLTGGQLAVAYGDRFGLDPESLSFSQAGKPVHHLSWIPATQLDVHEAITDGPADWHSYDCHSVIIVPGPQKTVAVSASEEKKDSAAEVSA